MQTKRCTKCGRELPLSEFCKQKTGKYGLMPVCRTCNREKVREWQAAHPEWRREKQRRYRQRKKEKIQKRIERKQKKEKEFNEKEFNRDVLGGYKASVLNYVPKREFKFNLCSTAGDVFRTNDKREFLTYLEKVL